MVHKVRNELEDADKDSIDNDREEMPCIHCDQHGRKPNQSQTENWKGPEKAMGFVKGHPLPALPCRGIYEWKKGKLYDISLQRPYYVGVQKRVQASWRDERYVDEPGFRMKF